MSGINKVILVGHLGKDLEVKEFGNDRKVGNGTIATSESYKGKDGQWHEKTEWHNLVLWRTSDRMDAIANVFKKGTLMYVEGKIRTRDYQDNEGVTRYRTEIEVDKFTTLGPRNSDGKNSKNQSSNGALVAAEDASESDDLPF